MGDTQERERATQPEDLDRLFIERLNAGDVEGVVALYAPGAVWASRDGRSAPGPEAIRRASRQTYQQLIAHGATFEPERLPVLRNGDIALTATDSPEGTRVAHRQPDGTWLWIIDHTNALWPTR